MKGKIVLPIIVLILALSACAAEPERIVETVVHEATVEVLQTVEVTRQVEVPVEVTRQVEVVEEVEVEVTRIVEVVVTATPEPTSEPTLEPTPTQTVAVVAAAESPAAEPAAAPAIEAPPPADDVAVLLLQASRALHDYIINFRDHGMGSGNCFVVVENQDRFLTAPSFDVSGAPDEVQWAYGHYQAALELAKDAALGIGQGCREAIETQTSFSITGLNYNDIRGKLERGLEEVDQGIDILEALTGA